MVSCLTFKSLSHFEFTFMYGEKVCSNLIDLHMTVRVFQHHFQNDCFFSLYILASFVEE